MPRAVAAGFGPLVLALVLALAAWACGDEASGQCKEACERADECSEVVTDVNYKFDKGECLAACGFLEKDQKGALQVERYVDCIRAASTCEGVNRCE